MPRFLSVAMVAVTLATGVGGYAQPSATVHVRLLEADTGIPIRDAALYLSLFSINAQSRDAITDADGMASFHQLAAGVYRLEVFGEEHSSHRRTHPEQELWQRDPNATVWIREPGLAEIRLATGASERITLRLPRGAVIAGTVVDAGGPLSGVRVSLFQDVEPRGAVPLVSRLGETMTGAEGTFQFAGLPEGTYRLAANRDQRTAADIFFPRTTSLESSEALHVKLGDRRQILFRVEKILRPFLSGRVVDSGPVRGGLAGRRLDIDTGDVISLEIIPIAADGSFVASSIAPARHGLIYTRRGKGDAVFAAAFRTVQVGEKPEVGIELRARPAASVSGTFRFNGGKRPSNEERLAVTAWAVDADAELRLGLARSATNGLSFRVDSLFGHYRFSVDTPRGWLPVAILLEDGQDILHTSFEVAPGRHYRNVRIVLTNEVASIVGSVPPGIVPADGVSLMVVAFPADESNWMFHDQVAKATVQSDGGFEIRDVRPGREYFVALCGWPCATTETDNIRRSKAATRVTVDGRGAYRVVLRR